MDNPAQIGSEFEEKAVKKTVLNLFYQEPDPDRWFPGDRYPRRMARRIIRGPKQPGGHERVFLNLKKGLTRLGFPFRENDFAFAKNHPEEPVGIIGKPHVLDRIDWKNPILFGAAIFSHPSDDPDVLQRRPIRKILVPGEWMRQMCKPFWGEQVEAWPVGIDENLWKPVPEKNKKYDFLIYDKIRWDHDHYEEKMLKPIRQRLNKMGASYKEIRYGRYREKEFHRLLMQSKQMVFLCEHETQGIAYQQALSMGIPILAWDRGGYWRDPAYYPLKERFSPVSSVPYWSSECGEKFSDIGQFDEQLEKLLTRAEKKEYNPRGYIEKNLSLSKCAWEYARHLLSLNK